MGEQKLPGTPAARRPRLPPLLGNLLSGLNVIFRHPSAVIGLFVVSLFIVVAILAPLIAPFGPFEVSYGPNHAMQRLAVPSANNLFGTTNTGMDVFSQLVWGSQVALTVGLLDRKSTRLNSSHIQKSRMPSSA